MIRSRGRDPGRSAPGYVACSRRPRARRPRPVAAGRSTSRCRARSRATSAASRRCRPPGARCPRTDRLPPAPSCWTPAIRDRRGRARPFRRRGTVRGRLIARCKVTMMCMRCSRLSHLRVACTAPPRPSSSPAVVRSLRRRLDPPDRVAWPRELTRMDCLE